MKETALVKIRREKAEELYPVAMALLERDFSSVPSLNLSFYSQVVYSYALAGVSGLKSVTIPNATVINMSAFYNVLDLETINGTRIDVLNSSAITSCPKLKTLSFPELTVMSDSNISSLPALESLYLPKLKTLNGTTITDCSNLKTIAFPELTTMSGYDTLSGCTNLETFSAPKLQSITSPWNNVPACIDFGKFSQMTYLYGLSNYKGSSFVTSQSVDWGFGGIWNSPNLKVIDSPNASMGMTIHTCPVLETVNLPLVSQIINSNLFSGCSTLSTINMHNAQISIGAYAFCNCTNLSEICFSKATWGLTYYSSSAFYNMSSISRFILPNTFINSVYSSTMYNLKFSRPLHWVQLGVINYLYSYAFESFYNMRRFAASHVSFMSSYVFANCSNLSTVLFGQLYNIYSSAFVNASAIRSLYILNSNTIPTLQYTNAFAGTPFVSSYDGSGGFASIFVRESMRSSIITNANWMTAMNEARIVGLTDEEVASVLAQFGWADNRSWQSTISS